MRHCILTPELAPFIRNGGVGTNALHLSEFLVAQGGSVHILVTTVLPDELKEDAKALKRLGHAKVTFLQDVPPRRATVKVNPARLAVSLEAHWWLEQQEFDVVHCMQYSAVGFAAIRAKRLGLGYARTQFVAIVNSPERWLAEHGKRRPDGSGSGLVLDFMERYCLEHADHVTCPTTALVEWLRGDNWKLPANTWVLPTHSPAPLAFQRQPEDKQHIVFFGRLETRKGLELFVEAVQLLARSAVHAALPLRFTFLGKVSMAAGISSESYLKQQLADLPPAWKWEIIAHLDQPDAMRYLQEHSGALFVMPSLTDNSPNTVLECLARGLRMLCSDAPGVSELFADRAALVPLKPAAWAERLAQVITDGLPPAVPALKQEQVREQREKLLNSLEATRKHLSDPGRIPASASVARTELPLISVVVPHYNAGEWLPQTLEALARQTYPNFEVIIVDDGSTCERSLGVFKGLEAGDQDSRFTYYRQANGGVCAARNHGVARSQGSLIMFVDADNVPFPDMLATLERCMEHAQLDVVTCDLYSFRNDDEYTRESLELHWAFAGGCLEGALKLNCLGDSNLLVRRSAYEAVGGFRSAENEASADRALLVRLLKSGARLDCVAEPLFAYRLRANSMSASSHDYARSLAVMEAFTEGLDPWLQRLMESNFVIYGSGTSGMDHAAAQVQAEKITSMRQRLQEEREKRRERDQRVDYLYDTITQWRRTPLVRLARFLKIIPRQY